MKKDHVRDYAVAAFRLYASLGCCSLSEAEQKIRQASFTRYETCEPQFILKKADMAVRDKSPELADIAAVEKMLLILSAGGKSHIVTAVSSVYFAYPNEPIRKGDISARVTRLSVTMPASIQSIYKWLKEARMLFAILRGLRIE